MSSFTPGPWHARRMKCQTEKHTYNSEVIAADGSEVTTILKEPDARLIAAAPDLLQALESMLQCANEREPFSDAGMWEYKMRKHEVEQKARAAIAKAKGEQ